MSSTARDLLIAFHTENITSDTKLLWNDDTIFPTSTYTFSFHEPTIHELIQEGIKLAEKCIKKKRYDLFDRVSDMVEKMIRTAENN